MIAFVKRAQPQETSVTGDLAAGKITVNGTMAVEGGKWKRYRWRFERSAANIP